ncbi:DNA cytosine methyltransferase [Photorhabdus viridis]|uniref:DNA cytosine methyltransferase n=1 Tax=Photorhabdus viridis TaxID=3163327 RepID=UPI0033072DF0
MIVWENVPGVLSSRDNAFGCFLAGLTGEDEPLQPSRKKWTNSGYVSGPQRAVAWRVLDAQYFGVAQRRRRVFVVASARTDICPAKILFELGSMCRDSEPRRTARETVTGNAGSCTVIGSHWESGLNPHPTLNQSHNVGGIGMSNQELFSQRGSGLISTYRLLSFGEYRTDDISSTLRARDDKSATDLIATLGVVRRLTPVECERLQGFPDNHIQIPCNGKASADCPDGHRYRAIGNAMAVPVMAWIGKRILMQARNK